MKPDWKAAPPWAEWLAMDADGRWTWHERKPRLRNCHGGIWDWVYTIEGVPKFQAVYFENWQKTLEQRPKGGENK